MITGDVSAASSLIVAIPTVLLELSYSRKFETEADDFAFKFLQQQHIETHYFADIMTRLMELEKEQADSGLNVEDGESTQTNHMGEQMEQYLSTHPATQERVLRFQ